MTELCFDDCTGGNLYEINSTDGNALHSEDIIILDLQLNYGSLKGYIFKNQAEREIKIYQSFFDDNSKKELMTCYREKLRSIGSALSKLNEKLKDGEEIRLWLSNNAFDRCALYWFCDYAKKYDCKIYIVLCPGVEQKQNSNIIIENTRWAASCNLSYMASFAEKNEKLSKEQIDLYADLWEKLVEENAALRILIDNRVISTSEDFFDNAILRFISEEPKSQVSVISDFLGKWYCSDFGFVSERIEYFIKIGKIEIVENKTDNKGSFIIRTIKKQ